MHLNSTVAARFARCSFSAASPEACASSKRANSGRTAAPEARSSSKPSSVPLRLNRMLHQHVQFPVVPLRLEVVLHRAVQLKCGELAGSENPKSKHLAVSQALRNQSTASRRVLLAASRLSASNTKPFLRPRCLAHGPNSAFKRTHYSRPCKPGVWRLRQFHTPGLQGPLPWAV